MQLVEFDPRFVEDDATPESYRIGNRLMTAAIAGLGKDQRCAMLSSNCYIFSGECVGLFVVAISLTVLWTTLKTT